jgi:hypothetical protein
LGGALQAWLSFLPSAAVYFFIVANVTTARRLKIVALASVAASLALVAEAFCGYYAGFLGDTFVLRMRLDSDQAAQEILRLRGVGFLQDPNDLSQILIIALALLFFAWREGRIVSNSVFVLAPSAILLWAIYLTHSRGALIGLAVFALMAGYKRLGKFPSLVLAAMLGVAMMALDFTGGRDISASAGVDRLSLWASGLQLFKSAPIFGVGFGNFTDLAGQTAHNSFILPLAELGVVGATIWVALLVTTTMDLNRLIALQEEPATLGDGSTETSDVKSEDDGVPTVSDYSFDANQVAPIEDQALADTGDSPPAEHNLVEVAQTEDQSSVARLEYESHDVSAEASPFSAGWLPITETNSVHEPIVPGNWLVLIRLALAAFVTTSWFLSRTYVATTYLILGLATAAIALEPSATEKQDRRRWMYVTLAVEAAAIILVYFIVRLRH